MAELGVQRTPLDDQRVGGVSIGIAIEDMTFVLFFSLLYCLI